MTLLALQKYRNEISIPQDQQVHDPKVALSHSVHMFELGFRY